MACILAVRRDRDVRHAGAHWNCAGDRIQGQHSPLQVLLVEDNEADADLCREYLESAFSSVAVQHVTRLAQAIDALRSERRAAIHVVLLDLNLPDAFGLDALIHIREIASELPIVVLTGSTSIDLGLAAIRAHAEDYCPKHMVTSETLGRIVAHAVERHRWRNRYLHLLEISPDGMVVLDAQDQVLFVNPAARRLLGAGQPLGAGSPIAIAAARIESAGELTLPGDHVAQVTVVDVDWEGKPARLVTLRDITPSKRAEMKLLDLVRQDQLTRLASRSHFLEFLVRSVSQSRRSGFMLALMFIDLDRFKSINDSLGHSVGDTLLQHVALRFTGSVRSSDFLGRLGGDEFGLILPAIKGPQEAAAVAEKLLAALSAPIAVEGRELTVGASIGIAVYPGSGFGADELLRAADTAMYRAKECGRNAYHFYSEEMQVQAMRRMHLEASLRRSWETRQFQLAFQPVSTIAGDRVVALEALLRWPAPQFAHIGPGEFVPMAEDIGLIADLGAWVLHEAVAQAAAWRQAVRRPICVAVNVSGRQLHQPGFVDLVVRALTEFAVPPYCLELEVTESVFIEDAGQAAQALDSLRRIGVHAVIDDFGTGYSSLSYLLNLPITGFKLDKRFIDGLGQGARFEAIIENLIRMAHAVGLRVTAEGVETEAQRIFLADCGCDLVQGYLFGRPLPATEVEAWLLAAPERVAGPMMNTVQ
ncbi:MAG TPA: EAL domain-containing protein [Burkholderiaceae bacterium]|nr:EAL domain-containing protein [Burkholderiaceae bacterium]